VSWLGTNSPEYSASPLAVAIASRILIWHSHYVRATYYDAFMINAERLLYVDESYYDSPDVPRFYTMTGALIDFSHHDSYQRMIRDLQAIARRQPIDRSGHRGLHSTEMAYDPIRQPDLECAQQVITDCDAVSLVVTVRTYLGKVRTSEDARQICLTDLVTRIGARGSLAGVTLDTRDNLGMTGQSAKAEPGSKNARDLRTLQDLKEVGELDPTVKVYHARDEVVRQLWIPDVVGYVVARSLARHDPGYMRILAGKVEIYEATRLPPAMRGGGMTS